MHVFEKNLLVFLIGFMGLLVCTFLFPLFKTIFRFSEGMTTQEEGGGGDETKTDSEFKNYDTSNSDNMMMLIQQNAGNILSLKQQVKDQSEITNRVISLETSMKEQQAQLDALVEQQAQYAEDISASEPVQLSGMET